MTKLNLSQEQISESRPAPASSGLQVRNRTRKTVLADRCVRAGSILERAFGLIPRSHLAAGEGLLLPRTAAITTCGMRFAIDVLFLDQARRVVHVVEDVPPWRVLVSARNPLPIPPWRTGDVLDALELPAGSVARTGTRVGDQLDLNSNVSTSGPTTGS